VRHVHAVLDVLLSTTVRVERGRLSLANRILDAIGAGDTELRADQVRDIAVEIGLRSGTTVYYDLAVTDGDGKKRLAGRTIASKREAEWLVARIKGALGGAERLAPPGVR